MTDSLIRAVGKNDVALVKELIRRGADVNGADVFGCTALYWAVWEGRFECAKVLLEANADVNKADNVGLTPLHRASYFGHAECVKLLIDWKANVNAKTDNGHDSPLHFSAQQGRLACVEMLIQAGAELDERNKYGRTPLAGAINENKPGVAELLLDKGAKMTNVNEDVEITDWISGIVAKRENARRSLTTFIGILRKRFSLSGGGTEYTRGRLPRDVVGVISRWAWTTRFDMRWMVAAPEALKKLKSCNHKCKDKNACAHKCCKR